MKSGRSTQEIQFWKMKNSNHKTLHSNLTNITNKTVHMPNFADYYIKEQNEQKTNSIIVVRDEIPVSAIPEQLSTISLTNQSPLVPLATVKDEGTTMSFHHISPESASMTIVNSGQNSHSREFSQCLDYPEVPRFNTEESQNPAADQLSSVADKLHYFSKDLSGRSLNAGAISSRNPIFKSNFVNTVPHVKRNTIIPNSRSLELHKLEKRCFPTKIIPILPKTKKGQLWFSSKEDIHPMYFKGNKTYREKVQILRSQVQKE